MINIKDKVKNLLGITDIQKDIQNIKKELDDLKIESNKLDQSSAPVKDAPKEEQIVKDAPKEEQIVKDAPKEEQIVKDAPKEEQIVKNFGDDIICRLENIIDKHIKEISKIEKYKTDKDNEIKEFKLRIENDKVKFKRDANIRIIKDLLDPINDINIVLQKDENEIFRDIKRKFYKVLSDADVEIIEPRKGEDFDFKKEHNEVGTEATNDSSVDKVINIVKIGCKFKTGDVIERAQVITSKNNKR